MSVKISLAPRYAVALARAAARTRYEPITPDEQEALDAAIRRLVRAMVKHRVVPPENWGTNAQGRPR